MRWLLNNELVLSLIESYLRVWINRPNKKCIRSQSIENDKTAIFDRFFFNYKFLWVKTVANTNKKIWWGHIDWKLKLKKNELFLLISLWLFKLCDKMQLTFCVANITMPTSFHQCLGVKPCSEKKFPYKICFSVMWKVVAQSTTFVPLNGAHLVVVRGLMQ